LLEPEVSVYKVIKALTRDVTIAERERWGKLNYLNYSITQCDNTRCTCNDK